MSHQASTVESGKVTVDLSNICKVGRELVQFAVLLGWYARNTHGGGVLLTAPLNKRQKITVPAKSGIQDHNASAWADRLVRYADPVRLLALEAQRSDAMETGKDGFAWQAWVGPDGEVQENLVYSDPEPEPEPVVPPVRTPTVLSERAWLAKNGKEEGWRYESGAVIERRWSDGSLDYRCALDGCGYTSATPQTVAAHYRSSKDHPKVDGNRHQLRTEPYEVKHRGAAQRAAHLAAQIAAALEDIGKSLGSYDGWTELAVEVAEKIIADRDENRNVEESERGPLTPEQVLERIRVLVDNGQFVALREENDALNERVAELEVSVGECGQRAEDAENEAAAIRGEWEALNSFIQQRPGAAS